MSDPASLLPSDFLSGIFASPAGRNPFLLAVCHLEPDDEIILLTLPSRYSLPDGTQERSLLGVRTISTYEWSLLCSLNKDLCEVYTLAVGSVAFLDQWANYSLRVLPQTDAAELDAGTRRLRCFDRVGGSEIICNLSAAWREQNSKLLTALARAGRRSPFRFRGHPHSCAHAAASYQVDRALDWIRTTESRTGKAAELPPWARAIRSTDREYLSAACLQEILRVPEAACRIGEIECHSAGDVRRRQAGGAAPEESVIFPVLLSAADFARHLDQPASRVETFLGRYRRTHPDCAIEVPNPKRTEPRYLYRTADVWPALQERLSEWQRLTDG